MHTKKAPRKSAAYSGLSKKQWFSKFISYYKPYKWLFFADVSCAVIVAAIALLFPLCVRYITKDILEGGLDGALQRIYLTGLVMVVLIAVQMFCQYFYDARGHAMGAMMESDMRNELFAHYQKLPFSFHDEQKPGLLMSRLTNDLLSLSEFYHHAPEDLIIYSVKFIGAFIILFNTNIKLTMIVFAFLPFMGIFTLYFGKLLNRAFKVNLERIGDVNAQVEQNLSGIRVVKSFAREEEEKRKFRHENNRFLDGRKTIYTFESYFDVGIQTMTRLITTAVAVFGGAAILDASLGLADLITFIMFVGYLIEPLPMLAHIVRQYQEGIAGFNRFMEMLRIEPDIKDAPNATELTNVKGNVQFKNVAFRYKDGGEYILKNISIDVKAGEYVAVVGYSGVGKTTLCSLIPRFYEVSEGSITLDGTDLRDIKLDSLRRNVSVVQQDVYLFAGTVLDNILYGKPDASLEEVVQAAKRANAHEFIENLPDGYHTDIGHRGIRLSGGQKQRISIARSFLKNAPVLILDEATSSLDNESERAVQDSLEELAKRRTTFIIAHRLSTIRNAQRIVVLSESGIEEQGSHDQLMALGGKYAELYNMQ